MSRTKLGISVDADVKARAAALLKEQGVTMTAFVEAALGDLISGKGHFINPSRDQEIQRLEAKRLKLKHQLKSAEEANDPYNTTKARHALAHLEQELARAHA